MFWLSASFFAVAVELVPLVIVPESRSAQVSCLQKFLRFWNQWKSKAVNSAACSLLQEFESDS